MLDEISIENLGVISTAHVELSSGLTAITGETGAGKTMVLTGLSLLMGAKSDPATVRTGAASAVVEGRVSAINGHVMAMVDDAGGVLDNDGALIISRSVASAGRSRTYMGGRSVPQQMLSDVASELVTIHGQSEQIRLKTPSKQREALDEFAGPTHQGLVEKYRSLWAERLTVDARREELVTQQQERAREAELLRLGLAEIERVAPQPLEDDELLSESQKLANVESIRSGVLEAHVRLTGGEFLDGEGPSAVIDSLDAAVRALASTSEHDKALEAFATRMRESQFALSDIAADISLYIDGLESDPARLEFVEQRRAEIAGLTRSYGPDVESVLTWASEAGLRLMDLEDDSANIARLNEVSERISQELVELALQITQGRHTAATDLSEGVSHELEGLAMKGARLLVEIDPLDELGPWGSENVSMLLIPHPGAPARPLGKGASGGELSRVMLALEVTLATASTSGARGVPTMIFDEVDAGVGGQAAIEIGKRLARLAQTFQIIVVTHLPQVAAFADHQLVVTKGTSGEKGASGDVITQSGITVVTGTERVAELARMLSGQAESSSAREHAQELLNLAAVRT